MMTKFARADTMVHLFFSRAVWARPISVEFIPSSQAAHSGGRYRSIMASMALMPVKAIKAKHRKLLKPFFRA